MLISNAYAQAAGAVPANDLTQYLLPVLMVGIFYFLMIRPQMKKAKEHKALLSNLAKGDEVLTASGILGRVIKVGENSLSIEIADKIEIQMQKASITTILPKGTLKSL